MVDHPDPADTFLAQAELFPTFDRDTRHALLKRARDGDAGARHDYVYALCQRSAWAALAARPAWLRRVYAIQQALIVLRDLVEDPAVTDPEQVLVDRVRDHLRAMQPPPASR
jgi:hypothetical protein